MARGGHGEALRGEPATLRHAAQHASMSDGSPIKDRVGVNPKEGKMT